MKSTDTNLNNPLRVDVLDICNESESWISVSFEIITQDMYDLMNFHDPLKIYIIDESPDGRIYLGDNLIPKAHSDCKYLVGIDKDTRQYVLYMNIVNNYIDRLIPVCKYNDPEQAFDAMLIANNAGSAEKINLSLFSTIAAYIDGYITIHDIIIGSICLFGYKNDPRLQNVIEVSVSFGASHSKSDLPMFFKEELPKMYDQFHNDIFKIYANIYNIIVKYNFFKDDKYHQGFENLDLAQPIADIIQATKIGSKHE